jgi:hypothetical protein
MEEIEQAAKEPKAVLLPRPSRGQDPEMGILPQFHATLIRPLECGAGIRTGAHRVAGTKFRVFVDILPTVVSGPQALNHSI